MYCKRCQRKTHYATNCYAKTKANGQRIGTKKYRGKRRY